MKLEKTSQRVALAEAPLLSPEDALGTDGKGMLSEGSKIKIVVIS
jgi:hypothetical protein